MEISSSDPDVETIYNRIRSSQWNLRPDFQRGEVWSEQKKARLIDTILRGWHVPPVHVVRIAEKQEEEVLDGQQRLAAIRDFKSGALKVNGRLPPRNETCEQLHGLRFQDLPPEVQRFFDRQTIRVLTILKYEPDEPGELFYRLNQPTSLTAAEQRNAFFGPVRSQIRELVEMAESQGVNEATIGFSNSRMAYDDVIARLAATLQSQSLWEKISAGRIAEIYRSSEPLSDEVNARLMHCVRTCAAVVSVAYANTPRALRASPTQVLALNKATLFSWMLFIVEADLPETQVEAIAAFLVRFEHVRELEKLFGETNKVTDEYFGVGRASRLLEIYNDRASARVADATSIVLRDAITWIFAVNARAPNQPILCTNRATQVERVLSSIDLGSTSSTQHHLLEALRAGGWGRV